MNKARLKTGEPRKRKKPGYRVTNARAYNQSLRKRGMISLYVPGGDLKAQLINAKIRTPSVSGNWLRVSVEATGGGQRNWQAGETSRVEMGDEAVSRRRHFRRGGRTGPRRAAPY
ncbi:hypothetical protein KAF44_25750 (plasmid) [Cupriavidus necator]|nr:hypothetical protein KAF44_25750 [Cupriavidus necator]